MGMLPDDSDLLFDEIGAEPVQASPIAQLAARPVEELPPSTVAPSSGTIKGALSTVLALRMNARFRRGTAVGAPSAVAPSSQATNQPATAPSGEQHASAAGSPMRHPQPSASTAGSPTANRNTEGFPSLDNEGG